MLKVIEHHSASAGNTFIDCPQMWIIEKIYGFETEENARMKMGHAAEEAAHHALVNQITDEKLITSDAKGKYIERCGDNGGTTDDEYEWTAQIANTFVKELKQYGKLIHYQREYNGPLCEPGLNIITPLVAVTLSTNTIIVILSSLLHGSNVKSCCHLTTDPEPGILELNLE